MCGGSRSESTSWVIQLSIGRICIHQLQIKCKKKSMANIVIPLCDSDDGTDMGVQGASRISIRLSMLLHILMICCHVQYFSQY